MLRHFFFHTNLLSRVLIPFSFLFFFSLFSIVWQVSVNQDLLPGNMILTEVILENKKQIYRVLSLLLVLNRPDACNCCQIVILNALFLDHEQTMMYILTTY